MRALRDGRAVHTPCSAERTAPGEMALLKGHPSAGPVSRLVEEQLWYTGARGTRHLPEERPGLPLPAQYQPPHWPQLSQSAELEEACQSQPAGVGPEGAETKQPEEKWVRDGPGPGPGPRPEPGPQPGPEPGVLQEQEQVSPSVDGPGGRDLEPSSPTYPNSPALGPSAFGSRSCVLLSVPASPFPSPLPFSSHPFASVSDPACVGLSLCPSSCSPLLSVSLCPADHHHVPGLTLPSSPPSPSPCPSARSSPEVSLLHSLQISPCSHHPSVLFLSLPCHSTTLSHLSLLFCPYLFLLVPAHPGLQEWGRGSPREAAMGTVRGQSWARGQCSCRVRQQERGAPQHAEYRSPGA